MLLQAVSTKQHKCARPAGDNQYGEEVLAMALYSLEAAWHSGFDVASANCRLDYEVEDNKGLFTALFRHLQVCRCCWRCCCCCCCMWLWSWRSGSVLLLRFVHACNSNAYVLQRLWQACCAAVVAALALPGLQRPAAVMSGHTAGA
jgi:hypothetical protein